MAVIKAKTIEIYLPTGDASKISHARITTEAIRIVYVHKSEIENQRKELERIGCYILVGQDNDGKKSVYIGETESLYNRLNKHKREKEFWSAAYTIQNLGGTFDKAHLTYLEQLMIEKANEADRYLVHNGNNGKNTKIPESKKNECLIYFETIQTLIKSLGFDVFVPEVDKKELNDIPHFYFQNNEGLWDAEGVYVDEKFIVLKGSISRREPTNNKMNSNELKFRDKLIEEGIIKTIDGKLVFVKDYSFNSPSYASNVVSLGSNSGWLVWKTKEGKKLGEVFKNK